MLTRERICYVQGEITHLSPFYSPFPKIWKGEKGSKKGCTSGLRPSAQPFFDNPSSIAHKWHAE